MCSGLRLAGCCRVDVTPVFYTFSNRNLAVRGHATESEVAFDTKIPLLRLTFVLSTHAYVWRENVQILDLPRYIR